MKKFLIFFILIVFFLHSKAQYHRLMDFGKSNGIYLELQIKSYDFGPSFASLNYERYFGKFKSLGVRAGAYITTQPQLLMPITVQYIANSRKKHQFELGFGGFVRTNFEENVKTDMPAMLFPMAYRFQETDKFYVRMGINFVTGINIYMKPFFSLGHRF